MLDDSRSHPVVESHLTVFEVILEMDVGGRGRQVVDDPGQREVVGCDQADRAASNQATNDGLGTDAPIVRIGPVEEFIQQEEQRSRPA